MLRHAINYIKKYKSLLFLIIPAFILQMSIMMPSGTNFCIGDRCGIHFWGVHSHDAMWHLEIAAVSFKTIPFIVPTFAGEVLSGYNVLMDLVLHLISFIGIPPIFTLFKIVPVVWFLFYTLIAITLARKLHKSLTFVFITLFLIYFADHFGYILQLLREGSIFKGTQSFSLQSLTALLNTQFALTLPIVMAQLILLKEKKFSLRNAVIMGVLTFFSMGLKFYGGVISLSIVGFYLLESLIEEKKVVLTFLQGSIIAIFTILSVIIFYNPFAATQSGSIFTFAPFATVHSVIEAPNMIYLPDMVNARYFLYEHGWSPRLVYIELLSTFLYFILNFGTRIFGVFYIIWKIIRGKSSRFEFYVLSIVMIAFLLNIMLIQKGDWWNTVQFGYYGIFLANFLLAIFLNDLLVSGKKIGMILVTVILILTVPSSFRIIRAFMSPNTGYIPRGEIEAMEYLKTQPEGIVFNSFQAKEDYPFSDYRMSGYISAFTGKQLYLAHLGPLNIIGVDASERLERVKRNDCTMFSEVDYIYFVKEHDIQLINKCLLTIKSNYVKDFENNNVTILKRK